MKNRILPLVVLFFAFSCRHDEDAAPCSAPDSITIDSACDTGKGVTLSVSNYGGAATGLEWQVYMTNDTLTSGFTAADLKIKSASTESLTVPDSLVRAYTRMTVGVTNDCRGVILHSVYYNFVKRKVGSCTAWHEKRI